jgi:positive regulator of sigma E activity
MTAAAVVVASRPDGLVDLEFAPARQCAGCSGSCLWRRLKSARLDRLRVAGALDPGTEVSVTIPARRLLLASLLLYGLPLTAILAGAALGSAIQGSDTGTLVGALTGLAVAVAAFGLVRARLERATLAGLIVARRS